MTSNEGRRRAVAELRKASTGAYRHVDVLDVIANSIGVDIVGKFDYEAEKEIYAALADFIDRPTCHDVGDDYMFKCSECGAEFEPVTANINEYGDVFYTPLKPLYCSVCGAEVVDA